MKEYIVHKNKLRFRRIIDFLKLTSDLFNPPLNERLDIEEYAKKIWENAKLVYALHDAELVGLIAYYLSDKNKDFGYITFLCVLPDYSKQDIGTQLLIQCEERIASDRKKFLYLEIDKSNIKGIKFFQKKDFHIIESKRTSYYLRKAL